MAIRTFKQIRNSPNPDDPLEIEYQKEEAKREAERLIEKYQSEPDFFREVLIAAVHKALPDVRQPENNRNPYRHRD